jgi:hypothetical protein
MLSVSHLQYLLSILDLRILTLKSDEGPSSAILILVLVVGEL